LTDESFGLRQSEPSNADRDQPHSMSSASFGNRALPISPLITGGMKFAGTGVDRGHRSGTKTAESLACQPQRPTLPALQREQPLDLARDIIARHRHDALAMGELELEHHRRLVAEGLLGRSKVEFPHAHEVHIVETLGVLAM